MTAPGRPLLRWHGGKWALAPWILSFFPPHRVYVEPFGGAFSIGLRKPRAYAEIWNDLDGELVNLMRVLRDERRAAKLIRDLELTPFARAEFEAAYRPARASVERARQLVIRSFMGHGSDGGSGVYRTGFRGNANRSHTTPAHDWANYPLALAAIVKRLARVVIECRPALEGMARHDTPQTLHYVDPPYLPETRARANRRPDNSGCYRHELSQEDHADLLAFLLELEGMVVLSGYPSDLYDQALGDWRRVEKETHADGALDRTEVLWINPAAQRAIGSGPLFEAAA